MQNQFISAAATASADGDRGLFYMACLSVDNLGMPVPMDERQAAELAHAALVRAADTLRAQLGPAKTEKRLYFQRLRTVQHDLQYTFEPVRNPERYVL